MDDLVFPISLERQFQLWSFAVTHNVLLLRSPRDSKQATRIDLQFRVVEEMRLPSILDDLEIDVLHAGDTRLAELGAVAREDCLLFALRSRELAGGYVLARSLGLSEDDLSDQEPTSINNPALRHRVVRIAGAGD
ncbi:hypothetical protein [Kutzneria sp. NPDC051319]|uniref:hypothetical protein n=1 Tax=Kutzneria sp. NPDC051319 TaxID=3155047 RepID=UPI00341DEB07